MMNKFLLLLLCTFLLIGTASAEICSETYAPCGGGCDATDLSGMFENYDFESDFDGIGDITGWDTSCIINMASMFKGSNFNQNISGWDTSNVIDMNQMFYDYTIFNQDIGGWDTSSVQDMSFMFCNNLYFNQDIGGWDVSQVTSMNDMFCGQSEIAWSPFNQDISSWDVSSVTNMNYMFHDVSFNQNLSSWDVTSVTAMYHIFDNVNMSIDNYDALLNGWASKNVQNGLAFYNNRSQYSSVGKVGRDILIDTYGWTITDGGLNEPEIPEEPEEINLSAVTTHYWNADDNYYDFFGISNGTNNGTSNVSGKIKYGWGFDGEGDYVEVGNINELDGTQNFTIWMWINATGYGEYDVSIVFSAIYPTQAMSWNIAGYNGGSQCFGKISIDQICSTDKINLSEDTLVSVVYDTDNDLLYFYKNGVLDSGGAISYGTTFDATSDYRFGLHGDFGNLYAFEGMMDEIGISNVAFTPEMQTELYNSSYGWSITPPEIPEEPEEPEETGFTSTGQAIFNIMDSAGAGLGIFMFIMGNVLPALLIVIVLVLIIFFVTNALSSLLKGYFKVR